jgi:hypothetical protein
MAHEMSQLIPLEKKKKTERDIYDIHKANFISTFIFVMLFTFVF